MNQELKRTIILSYNKSDKNKAKFLKLLARETGLTKRGMSRGPVADMISTFVFNEGKGMELKEAQGKDPMKLAYSGLKQINQAIQIIRYQSKGGGDRALGEYASELAEHAEALDMLFQNAEDIM